jgi:hypothetical protein
MNDRNTVAYLTGRGQPLAGRGEPDWRALAILALAAEASVDKLAQELDAAECLTLGADADRAAQMVADVRRECERHLAPAPAPRAGRKWSVDEDARLQASWGWHLRDCAGDPEATVESLARMLGRSPIAVAARLCHLGIWK